MTAMDCVTCPFCKCAFTIPVSLNDDFDDDDLDRVSCPNCCRSFDPFAKPDGGAVASQSASLDELVEFDGDGENGESER